MKRSSLGQQVLRDRGRHERVARVERALGEQCDLLELLTLQRTIEARFRGELATGEIAVVSEATRTGERTDENAEKNDRSVARKGGVQGPEIEGCRVRRARGDGCAAWHPATAGPANEARGLELPHDESGDANDDERGQRAE